MEKEYNLPGESNEQKMNLGQNNVEEPVFEYGTKSVLRPCQYTPEEIRAGVRRAVEQFEEGQFHTDDEIDDLILS